MPRGDGRGPLRPGSGIGRKRGWRNGCGSAGPGGYCVCPNCGTKVEHKPQVPCSSLSCPNCGIKMVRE